LLQNTKKVSIYEKNQESIQPKFTKFRVEKAKRDIKTSNSSPGKKYLTPNDH